MKTSKRLNQFNAQYTIPGKRPASDKLAIGTQVTEEKFPDGKYSLRNESGLTRIQKRGRFEQIIGLHYLSEVFRELPTDPKEQSHFVLPAVGFTWTNIEKGSPLQEGIYATFTVKGGLKSIISSTNLAQGKTQIKWNIAMGEKARLILRTDVGLLTATNAKGVSVPLSLRFFTGGDQTVRGYGYNSLGPTQLDKNGDEIVIGGRYLFVGSVELERRLYKNIGAAIYVDSGNAMNHWNTKLSSGAGVGLRYETALGSLRLDVARPLLKGKHKPRIHFSFGMNL
jgi:translocation and assembly module TamA